MNRILSLLMVFGVLLPVALAANALHDAARRGDCSAIKHLLGQIPIDSRDSVGNTPLHYAAYYGREKALKLLVDLGADTNARGWSRNTPLHFAAYTHHPANVRYLLAHGASVMARGWGGNQPLHFAAYISDQEEVRDLLRYGAPVNAKGWQGNTALHFASWMGFPEIVEILLRHGADPSLKNDLGLQAMDLARQMDRFEIIHMLRSHLYHSPNPDTMHTPRIRQNGTPPDRCIVEFRNCRQRCEGNPRCEFQCDTLMKACILGR